MLISAFGGAVSPALAQVLTGSYRDGSNHLFIGYEADDSATFSTGVYPTYANVTLGLNAGVTGKLTVTNRNTSLTVSGTVTVGAEGNGVLIVSNSANATVGTTSSGTITLARDAGSSGTLVIGAPEGATAVTAGFIRATDVAFGNGTGTIVFNHTGRTRAPDITFEPKISGTGSISHLAGTTILTGANTYGGTTTITGGTLVAASNTALGVADGTVANGTTVSNNATLRLAGGVAIGNEALSISGFGTNGSDGALHSAGGTNSFAGAINATGDSRISVDSGSSLTLSGPITGNGTLELGGFGSGTVTGNITNVNLLKKTDIANWTFTGQNSVNSAVFGAGFTRLQNGGTLTDQSGELSTGTVIVSGSGSAWINTTGAAIGTISFGTLTLTDGGAMVVGTQGDGKLILGSRNGFPFPQLGTLNIGAGFNDDPAAAGTVNAGVVTTEAGQGMIVFNHTGNPDGSDVTFKPSIAGNIYVAQVAGNTILPTANTYTGATDISGGTLTIQNANALGAADGTANTGTTVRDAGTLALQGGVAVGNEALDLFGGTLRSATGANSYAGSITVDADATVTVDAGSTLLLTGAVTTPYGNYGLTLAGEGSGTATGSIDLGGDLTKAGTGAWTLTGAINTDKTGVKSGTLNLQGGATLTDQATLVGDGGPTDGTATLAVSGAGTSLRNRSLSVGVSNPGVLTVSDGASVSSAETKIGAVRGMSGAATVTGANSSLNNVVLCVGCSGPGTLAVTNGGAEGGTLVSDTTTVAVDQGASGAITVRGANSTFISDTLSIGYNGKGTLTVADGGSVTASDSFLGYSGTAASGTVTVTGANSVWANTSSLTVGYHASGTVTVAEGGAVSVGQGGTGTVTLAKYAGSIGTLNIGAAEGAAPVAPGFVRAAAVTTGEGTGTIAFNHTSTGYTFDPVITGPTSVKQLAGTTVLTNTNPFTGPTTVMGGTLQVDGSVTSSAIAVTGGALAGSGTIASASIQAGGTLAPGNASSIGALTATGSLTFEPGSFYRVRVGGGVSDHVNVAGPVTINGGTVQLIAGSSSFLPGQTYTIISAPGGVTGTFTSLRASDSFAFLAPTLSYSATTVTVGIAQVAPFTSVATTANQYSTAAALDGVAIADGTGPASPASQVAAALLNQSGSGARQALVALSGEVQGSAVAAQAQTAFAAQTTMLDHLRFGAGTGPAGGQTMAGSVGQRFAAGTTVPAAYAALPAKPGGNPSHVTLQPEAPTIDVWGMAFGSFGSAASTRNTARLTSDTGGFVLGAETGTGALSDAVGRARTTLNDWRLGVAAGYSFTRFDVAGRSSSGQVESGFGSVYARGPLGPVQVRLGGSYAGNAYETHRTVAFPGFSQVANSRSGGDTMQGFGEVGYRIGGAQGYLEPFVNGALLRIHRDGFTETGGSAALVSFARNMTIETVSTGIQGQMVLADLWGGAGPLRARGLVGARFAFGDVNPSALLAFRGGARAFSTTGTPVATEAALVSAGLDWQVSPHTVVGLGYEGQLSSKAQDNAIKGSIVYSW